MKKIILLFFISSQVFSQKINFKGQLLDKETKQPIVYANISFLKSNIGISSTEKGTFNLEIEKKLINEKIHISCLNYNDTIVFAKDLQNKTLFLKSKYIELDEIVISKKVDKELIVDKYKRKDIKSTFGASRDNPWIITKYFPFKDKYKNTPYLNEVWVYFGAMIMRKKSKFRIRFYKKDPKTNKPSIDLLNEDIIAYSRKIDGKVKINISKYNLIFPKDGLFIGLERIHIPYNFYEYNYTMEGSKKKYLAKAVSPSFGATYSKDTIFIFSTGKWRKFFSPKEFHKGNQIQPAISLTLTN